jgi:condensin complex subunit 3
VLSQLSISIVEQTDDDEDEDDSPSDRFLSRLVHKLLPGCSAKDKTPRLTEILRHVPALDDTLYNSLRETLLERVNNKEWHIDIQAAHGLGVLARGEPVDDSSSDEDEDESSKSNQSVISVLRNLVLYDSQPEVRRMALPGIAPPLNGRTLSLLLSRCRDPDNNVRRTVYKLLRTVPVRGLSLTQRSAVVRLGLGDREESVRADTAKLVEHWALSLSNYGNTNTNGVVPGPGPTVSRGKDKANMKPKIDLDEFLDFSDLWDGEVAEEALKASTYLRLYLLDGLDLTKSKQNLFCFL